MDLTERPEEVILVLSCSLHLEVICKLRVDVSSTLLEPVEHFSLGERTVIVDIKVVS